MSRLTIDDRVPTFALPNQHSEVIYSGDYIGQKPLVLFFFPKAFTPTCTMENCLFRDSYQQFRHLGAEVIGISPDSVETLNRFSSRFSLPFNVLSDGNGIVAQSFGVQETVGIVGGRVSFVFDQHGALRHRFQSQFNINAHADGAYLAVQDLTIPTRAG